MNWIRKRNFFHSAYQQNTDEVQFPNRKLQISVSQANSIKKAVRRINLWEGSVRSGKTIASVIAWILYVAQAPEGDLLMSGKTDRSLYRNVIRIMEKLLGNDFYYNKGEGICKLWGRDIFVVSAMDERAEGKIRGMTCAGAYGDEVSLWPKSFFKMLMTRLSVNNSRYFGSTNPDNPKHYLKKDYIDKKGKIDIEVFHFDMFMNPFISRIYKDNLKKEYTGLWEKRFIKGLWVAAEGAIYDFWDENIHVLKVPPKADYYQIAIDYGTGHPTAIGLFGIRSPSKGNPYVWMEAEYYFDSLEAGYQKSDKEYSRDLRAFLNKGTPYNKAIPPSRMYIDPSAASLKKQLRDDGFMFINDANNSVIDGIRKQASMLKEGEYAICADCVQTISDYGGYVWDPKAQERGEDVPLHTCSHTKDMERYELYTNFGDKTIDLNKLTKG